MRTTHIGYTADAIKYYHDVEGQLTTADGIDYLNPASVIYLIVHCTATRCTADYGPADLIRDHKARGWNAVGYHFFIAKDGQIFQFRRTDERGAHCRGHNGQSIGIAYEGGLNHEGDPEDTMTTEQTNSMRALIAALVRYFPNVVVRGHRDFNSNKACPCFDARERFRKCTHERYFV